MKIFPDLKKSLRNHKNPIILKWQRRRPFINWNWSWNSWFCSFAHLINQIDRSIY